MRTIQAFLSLIVLFPFTYSEKAAVLYPSAELVVLEGAGHGFSEANMEQSIDNIYEYIKNHLN